MPFRFRHRGVSVKAPHPRRAHIHEHADLGARIGETVTRGMGSIRFIVAQTVIIAVWLAANIWLLGKHPFDPYPFILLNLLFSTQAAYASPLILLAQNRQAERDRKRDDTEASEVEANLNITQSIHGLTTEIHAGRADDRRILDGLDALTRAVLDHIMKDAQKGDDDGPIAR